MLRPVMYEAQARRLRRWVDRLEALAMRLRIHGDLAPAERRSLTLCVHAVARGAKGFSARHRRSS